MKKYASFLMHDGLWVRLLCLLGIVALGLVLTLLFSFGCILLNGNASANLTDNPGILRIMQFIQSILIFMLPALAMGLFMSGNPWKYLQLNRWPSQSQIVLTVASMFIMVPFMNQIIQWNEAIRLPEYMSGIEQWMREKENMATESINLILSTPSWGIRILNLLLVGVTAAVTEELFFRGMLQNMFLDKWHKKLLAVLLSAFLFSAIHVQFYGFVPRFILGAYFGLLLVWTGSLWIPILAHFTNNTCALIQFYIEQNQQGKALLEVAEAHTSESWTGGLLTLGSLILFVWVAFCIKKSGR